MAKLLSELLENSSPEEIIKAYKSALDISEEEDFWKEKIIPYIDAILSVLKPLQKQNLLFTPEGKRAEVLTSELFFRWADLVCLRQIAFILESSNEQNRLVKTEYENMPYTQIDLETLGKYLSSYGVNLSDENSLDFPISNYNLHTGMLTTIKTLIN